MQYLYEAFIYLPTNMHWFLKNGQKLLAFQNLFANFEFPHHIIFLKFTILNTLDSNKFFIQFFFYDHLHVFLLTSTINMYGMILIISFPIRNIKYSHYKKRDFPFLWPTIFLKLGNQFILLYATINCFYLFQIFFFAFSSTIWMQDHWFQRFF